MHIRKQIRNAIATAITGTATVGSRVHNHRVFNIGKTQLPAAVVYATQEQSSRFHKGVTPVLQRVVTIRIEATARANSNVADTLDQMASEIETAVEGAGLFGGLAVEQFLVATDLQTEADGDQEIGTVGLDFQVTYYTSEGAPETAA